jgi:hypothetical protein
MKHLTASFVSIIIQNAEMEIESSDAVLPRPQVNATFRLSTESYSVQAINGSSLSDQLVNMKEQSMAVLKDFITKHNIPQDVPDESLEASSEDDDDVAKKAQVKAKKTKLT